MSNDSTMKKTPKPPAQDWTAFDAMSAEERHAAALRDPDATDLARERTAHAADASGPGDPAGPKAITGRVCSAISHPNRDVARLGAGSKRPRRRRAGLFGGDWPQPLCCDGGAPACAMNAFQG